MSYKNTKLGFNMLYNKKTDLSLTLLFFNQNPVDLAILEYTNPLKHATFTHRI